MRKDYLLTPGPTPLPPEILAATSRPIIHHRTPQFMAILSEVNEGLKWLFRTKNDVFIFAASGTGGMEAAVANVLSPGDKTLVIRGGKFGERWAEMCQAFGAEVIAIDVEWGRAVDPRLIEERLSRDKEIRAVFATLCETSTGVKTDIQAIGKIVKDSGAILVVDAISGLGAMELETDGWFVDIVVAGSQKGLMLPPGLAFVSVSQKAWRLIEHAKSRTYYFDLKKAKKAFDKADTPFTPAVTLVVGLRESLKMIKEEGLERMLKRYKRLAMATRAAMKALGLELLSPASSADAVTAARVPEGIDGQKLVKLMRDTYGVTITGGQDHLKGKIFRIAHMGYIAEFDVLVALSALEMALSELGYKAALGAGIKAAEEIFLREK